MKSVSNVPSDYMDPIRWMTLTYVNAALARPEVAYSPRTPLKHDQVVALGVGRAPEDGSDGR